MQPPPGVLIPCYQGNLSHVIAIMAEHASTGRFQIRLHFHDLRHTHATWLIAQRVPMIAIAGRLGHANAVVTMMVYAHVDKLVDRGLLTVGELGLTEPAPVVSLATPRWSSARS